MAGQNEVCRLDGGERRGALGVEAARSTVSLLLGAQPGAEAAARSPAALDAADHVHAVVLGVGLGRRPVFDHRSVLVSRGHKDLLSEKR